MDCIIFIFTMRINLLNIFRCACIVVSDLSNLIVCETLRRKWRSFQSVFRLTIGLNDQLDWKQLGRRMRMRSLLVIGIVFREVSYDLENVNINDILTLTFFLNDDVKHLYTPFNTTRPVVFYRGFVLERLFNLKRPFW